MSDVDINYGRLPAYIRKRKQWVCFDIVPHPTDDSKTLKIPYIAGRDDKARSNDPSTFSTFEVARACVERGERDHLGYCVMKDDGLVFLDGDHTDCPEEQGKNKLIFQSFPSFSEKSVSGEGYHILMKGELTGRGLHNSHLGVFDDCRFVLVTGDVIDGRDKIKTANKKMLLSLQEEVRSEDSQGYDFDLEEEEWDAQPCFTLHLAGQIYGDLFFRLLEGNWQGHGYPSQSEADHALINMLCDVSRSNELVRYLFAESGLYREWKARKDPDSGDYSVKGYIDYSIKRNRGKKLKAKEVRERAIKNIKEKVEVKKKKKTKKVKKVAPPKEYSDEEIYSGGGADEFDYPTDLIDKIPSNLIKRLAKYIYKRSYKPNQQVAIMSAFVVFSKDCQRAWLTHTGTTLGLNWWVLGESGWGKDAFTKAIGWITSDLMHENPHYGDSHAGKFASGEGVETAMSEHKRLMSHVPEAGAYWRKVLNPHRPPHIDALAEAMLNLFMAGDPGSFWKTRLKAKKDDDLSSRVYRPSIFMYGESTPEDLFSDMDITAVKSGLLSRQVFFNIQDPHYRKPNTMRYEMPNKLKRDLSAFVEAADTLDHKDDTIRARITTKAHHMLQEYEEEINRYACKKEKNKIKADLTNRSAIKVFRLAAMLAVGDNFENPVVKEKHAEFAIKFIDHCDNEMVRKFETGDIGQGQLKQEHDMLKLIKQVSTAPTSRRRKSYRMNESCAEDPSIIPYSHLKNRAKTRSSFARDKFGAITAIDRCIDSMCRAGTLVRLTKTECEEEYDTAAGLLRYTGD